MLRSILALVLLAACGSSPPPATTAVPVAGAPAIAPQVKQPPIPVPLSDPSEYAIERISREAGRAIFERTGIGDPYRTGVPYPLFLAFMKGFPKTFGASPAELAQKFGFVARAADPASSDMDVRAGLPVGMHLTIDPITGIAFVVNSCALCHSERVRWKGGEADRKSVV